MTVKEKILEVLTKEQKALSAGTIAQMIGSITKTVSNEANKLVKGEKLEKTLQDGIVVFSLKEQKKEKKIGVIASILEIIQQAKKPISKPEILEKLKERFPQRAADSMMKTINVQLGNKNRPCRMERERGITFKVEGEGKEIRFSL